MTLEGVVLENMDVFHYWLWCDTDINSFGSICSNTVFAIITVFKPEQQSNGDNLIFTKKCVM